MTHLLEHVGAHYGIDPRLLVSPRRTAPIAFARQVCCFVMRKRFGMSYPQIGKIMHRDHSTVIHAVDKILWAQGGDPALQAAIAHFMEVPCSRFIPTWHKQAKERIWRKPGHKPGPPIIKRNEYADPPALAPLHMVEEVHTAKARNDFDTGDDVACGEYQFRKNVRKGSDALLAALRAA